MINEVYLAALALNQLGVDQAQAGRIRPALQSLRSSMLLIKAVLDGARTHFALNTNALRLLASTTQRNKRRTTNVIVVVEDTADQAAIDAALEASPVVLYTLQAQAKDPHVHAAMILHNCAILYGLLARPSTDPSRVLQHAMKLLAGAQAMLRSRPRRARAERPFAHVLHVQLRRLQDQWRQQPLPETVTHFERQVRSLPVACHPAAPAA